MGTPPAPFAVASRAWFRNEQINFPDLLESTSSQSEWDWLQEREQARVAFLESQPSSSVTDERSSAANSTPPVIDSKPVEAESFRDQVTRTAREHGYDQVIFDVGITGAVNLMAVGRNKLADFEGAVIVAHRVDSALRPIQVLGDGEALFTSSLAELPVLIVDFPKEIFEHSEFNLLQTDYCVIKGVTEYQGLRGRRQAVVVAPAW